MTIENLLRAVPPPAAPFEAFDGPWDVIEDNLDLELPQDYKDYVRLYGYGYFMEFLGICVPGSRNPNTRLELQARWIGRSFAGLNVKPYVMWPWPGGLLPFGGTDNGDYLFWLTRGAPSDWGVVVWDRGGLEFEEFEEMNCDLTDFLAGLATGTILPKAFPDLLPCERLFQPSEASG